jgi:hypothetical protein
MLASNKGLGAEELQSRFENYLASTESFTMKKGGSLAYFCQNVDSFLAGPLFERTQGGNNGNKKISADQRTRDNLAAAGLLNVH